jgi:hypothetical protein
MNDKLICFKEPFGESIVIMEQPLREGEEIFTNPIDSKTVDYILFAFKTDKMDGMMLQQQVSYDGGRTWYDSEKNIVVGSMTPEVFGYQLFWQYAKLIRLSSRRHDQIQNSRKERVNSMYY